jgi:hypothetical protein
MGSLFVTPSGEQLVYPGFTGTEKVYHTLDHAREAASGIGFYKDARGRRVPDYQHPMVEPGGF